MQGMPRCHRDPARVRLRRPPPPGRLLGGGAALRGRGDRRVRRRACSPPARVPEPCSPSLVAGKRRWKDLATLRHPADGVDERGAGTGRRILFQTVPEAKTVKNRVHLDLRVGRDACDAEVVGWSGWAPPRSTSHDGPDGYWVLLQDPGGNELDVAYFPFKRGFPDAAATVRWTRVPCVDAVAWDRPRTRQPGWRTHAASAGVRRPQRRRSSTTAVAATPPLYRPPPAPPGPLGGVVGPRGFGGPTTDT